MGLRDPIYILATTYAIQAETALMTLFTPYAPREEFSPLPPVPSAGSHSEALRRHRVTAAQEHTQPLDHDFAFRRRGAFTHLGDLVSAKAQARVFAQLEWFEVFDRAWPRRFPGVRGQ
jgi:hypothetical protein